MGERLKESKWFQIFSEGKWNGQDYTKDDLDKVVANFDKGFLRVPLIRGHNGFFGEEKPALGWVSALKRSGKKLWAKARNIDPELVEDVEQERYPERSIEIWHDYNGYGMALGAIAFLGGSNPAVDSMAPMEFASCVRGNGQKFLFAKDDDRVVYAFNASDGLEEDPDAEEEDEEEIQNSEFKVQNQKGGGEVEMTKEEMQAAIAEAITGFKNSDEFKALESKAGKVEQLQQDLTTAQENAAVATVKGQLQECENFAKQMLDERRVSPVEFNGLGALILSLDDSDKIEFEKGKTQQTPRERFKAQLKGRPALHKSLFETVDEGSTRVSEEVGEAVSVFADKFKLDPKIVAQQFKTLRTTTVAGVEDLD